MAKFISLNVRVPGDLSARVEKEINVEAIHDIWSGPATIDHDRYLLMELHTRGGLKDVVTDGKNVIFTHIKTSSGAYEVFESKSEVMARINGQYGTPRGLVNKSEGKPESKVSNK